MTLRRLISGLRHARWLTQGRITALGHMLLLIQLTILVMLALWQHGIINAGRSATASDFVSFYAAGVQALEGTPALAYDQAAHFLAEQRFTVPDSPYQYFFYPPVFLLLCAPLALMPYFVAFYVFECATLLAFILTMRAILRLPGWLWAGPVLAFPPVFWAFGLGQNTFLTAALFGWFTLLLERRPALAGAVLGMLCYKPHFGILVPAALACAGYWRTFLAAGAAVGGLIGLSVLLFGIDTWHAYLTAFAASDKIYATGKVDFAGMITPFGAARLLGIEQSGAYLTQTVFTAGMVVGVGLVWRRTTNPVSRNGVLLAATLLAVPVALLYDQLVLMVAIGWMAREAKSHGFLPWEKTCLAAMYLTALLAYAIGSEWKLPLFPLISAALLGLAIRRSGWIPGTGRARNLPSNKLAMGANSS